MDKIILMIVVFAIMGMITLISDTSAGDMETTGNKDFKKATFAGGCFWCMEPPFDKLDGVISTTVGYTGGTEKDPTYEEVASGRTSHTESIEVLYDPSKISYRELVDVFWQNIDPTQVNGQFVDRGPQYRTAIFYHNEDQRREAVASKDALEKSGRVKGRIVTEIIQATDFFRAEEYHQDYYMKSPSRYKFYRSGSGRDQYIKNVWGKEKNK